MRFLRSIGLLMLALGILAVPAHAAAAKPKKEKPPKTSKGHVPDRRAWMFGVSPGFGGTRFVSNGQTLVGELRSDTPTEYPPLLTVRPQWVGTDIEAASTLQYRLGYSVNPRLMLSIERAQWFKDFGRYSWRFNSSIMSATFYPRAGHLFVRGGGGLSAMTEKVASPTQFFVQATDRGFGLEGAVGYEWNLFKRVTISPELTGRGLIFSQAMSAQMGSASVAFNWWF